MTEADLYTVEALRPRRSRGWLAVCVVAVCALLGWCAWLGFEAWQVCRYAEHNLQMLGMRTKLTEHIAELCFDGGGTYTNGECETPPITFSVIPFSQGSLPTPPAPHLEPAPGEPVFPMPLPPSGDSRL